MDTEPFDQILSNCAQSHSCINWWICSSWRADYYIVGI